MAKKKNSPWAICTASVGRDDKAKYERCVKKVKKKVGVKESAVDDIRKISEMLTDDPDVFVEEGLPMAPDDAMVGGDAPAPQGDEMPADEGMPADDMAPEGDMPPMPGEEGGQWVIMKHGDENKVWGPYGSREEAIEELKACLQEEHPELVDQAESGTVTGEGFTKMVVPLESGDEEAMPGMPGDEEVGGEDLPPMGEPPMGAGGPPAEEDSMGSGALGMSGGMY